MADKDQNKQAKSGLDDEVKKLQDELTKVKTNLEEEKRYQEKIKQNTCGHWQIIKILKIGWRPKEKS